MCAELYRNNGTQRGFLTDCTRYFPVYHFKFILYYSWGSLVAQMVKNLPAMLETWVQSLGQEDPLEKKMATHSSLLAWKPFEQRNLVGYSPWACKELDST